MGCLGRGGRRRLNITHELDEIETDEDDDDADVRGFSGSERDTTCFFGDIAEILQEVVRRLDSGLRSDNEEMNTLESVGERQREPRQCYGGLARRAGKQRI